MTPNILCFVLMSSNKTKMSTNKTNTNTNTNTTKTISYNSFDCDAYIRGYNDTTYYIQSNDPLPQTIYQNDPTFQIANIPGCGWCIR